MLMLLMMMGCGDGRVRGHKERGVANRIETLEKCFHELDLDGIIDCIDPEDTAVAKAFLAGLNLITGGDSDALLEETEKELYSLACMLFDQDNEWPYVDGEESLREILNSVSIDADEISFGRERKDIAVANCSVTIRIGEEKIRSRVELYLIKSSGDWYLDIS